MVQSFKLKVYSLAMGVLDSSYIKALGVKSPQLKKIFFYFYGHPNIYAQSQVNVTYPIFHIHTNMHASALNVYCFVDHEIHDKYLKTH